MKQKTKKLLQLSFSLGFLATTALVATSCKQPMTVAPKPTDPSKPTEPKNPSTGNPEQPSNPTEPAKPVDTTEAKNKLKEVISTETEKLGMYADYSVIKGELEKAYSAAKLVSDKQNATEQELIDAKNKLDAAIASAESNKNDFNSKHSMLVEKYMELKSAVNQIKLDSLGDEPKYAFLKSTIEPKYNESKAIIDAGLQAMGLTDDKVNQAKTNLDKVSTNFDNKKMNADEIDAGKFYGIKDENIKTTATDNNETNYRYFKNNLSTDVNNSPMKVTSKSLVRRIKQSDNSWKVVDNSRFVGELKGDERKYVFTFDNFSSQTLYMYFFYKLEIKSDNSTEFNYEIKVNDSIPLTTGDSGKLTNEQIQMYADREKIYLAKIPLTNLNYGSNKVEIIKKTNDKNNILFGSISLLRDPGTNNENEKNLIYRINGQSETNGIIKIDLANAVGGSTIWNDKESYFENIGTSQDPIIVMKSASQSNYFLGIYIPEDGEYKFGADYNTNGDNNTIEIGYYVKPLNEKNGNIYKRFSSEKKLKSDLTEDNQDTNAGQRKFVVSSDRKTDTNQKIKQLSVDESKIQFYLKKGWNNIVIAKWETQSPNIQNLYLKKVETTPTATQPAAESASRQ